MSSPVKPSNKALSSALTRRRPCPSKSTASSPESGVSDELLEYEGTTNFAPAPSPTYRYSMTLEGGKLRVWLEDCESKKQWLASGLDQTAYVDSTNAIPNATASDYVEYFHQLLDGGYDDKDDTPITFQRHKGDVSRLEVTVTIQVLRQSRVATYAFDMEPISLERVDVLESKMRDMQEEIESLREEKVAATQAKVIGDRAFSELKAQMKLLQTQDHSESKQFQATTKVREWIAWGTHASGSVRMANPGTYQVTAVVNHKATASIHLFNDSRCIQTASNGNAEGTPSSTCLAGVTQVEKNGNISMTCSAVLTGTSYLTLIRIGK